MKGGEQLASFLEEQSVLVRELLLLLICDVALLCVDDRTQNGLVFLELRLTINSNFVLQKPLTKDKLNPSSDEFFSGCLSIASP